VRYREAAAAAVNVEPDGEFTKLFRISPNEPWRVLRTRLRSQGIVSGSDESGQPAALNAIFREIALSLPVMLTD
jgi:hypothetical protein